MKKYLLLFLTFIIFPWISPAQSLPDSITSQLRIMMEGFMKRYNSPSIAVAVVHDQDVIFSEAMGFADIENKISATANTRYPIQSITKVFTGTMLMQLYERGIVNLDDDIRKYVPEMELKSNSKSGLSKENGISLLQLATHTSGLPRNSPADADFARSVDRWMLGMEEYTSIGSSSKEEFLKSLKFIEREYPEYMLKRYGDRNYSNLGYSILGIALERASETDYKDFLRSNIFEQLEMENSGFIDSPGAEGFLVSEYKYDQASGKSKRAPVFRPNSALYAGGVYSTVNDLAKFIAFQFRENESVHPNVLSSKHVAMMQSMNISWKQSYPFVMHEGAIFGSRSVIVLSPELKIGWIILTNTGDFDFNRINEAFRDLITPVFAKPEVSDLHKYAGEYKLAGGYGSLIIRAEGGNLYSSYMEDALSGKPLAPLGGNRFRAGDANAYNIGYEFIFDDTSGKVILNLGQLMWVKKY